MALQVGFRANLDQLVSPTNTEINFLSTVIKKLFLEGL